jgi:hypothetical protein
MRSAAGIYRTPILTGLNTTPLPCLLKTSDHQPLSLSVMAACSVIDHQSTE